MCIVTWLPRVRTVLYATCDFLVVTMCIGCLFQWRMVSWISLVGWLVGMHCFDSRNPCTSMPSMVSWRYGYRGLCSVLWGFNTDRPQRTSFEIMHSWGQRVNARHYTLYTQTDTVYIVYRVRTEAILAQVAAATQLFDGGTTMASGDNNG